MYRVTVCYGKPADPGAFDSHYDQVHVALTREIPGLAGADAGRAGTGGVTMFTQRLDDQLSAG